MRANGRQIVEQSGWTSNPNGCRNPASPGAPLVCDDRSFTTSAGDSAVLSWYEGRVQGSLSDNCGTITVDVWGCPDGQQCERGGPDPGSDGSYGSAVATGPHMCDGERIPLTPEIAAAISACEAEERYWDWGEQQCLDEPASGGFIMRSDSNGATVENFMYRGGSNLLTWEIQHNICVEAGRQTPGTSDS